MYSDFKGKTSFTRNVKPIEKGVTLIKKDNTEAMQSVHFVKDSEKEAFCKWINRSVFVVFVSYSSDLENLIEFLKKLER